MEAALGNTAPQTNGFLGFVYAPDLTDVPETCTVEVWLKNGSSTSRKMPVRTVSNVDLRNLVLGYVASAEFSATGRSRPWRRSRTDSATKFWRSTAP